MGDNVVTTIHESLQPSSESMEESSILEDLVEEVKSNYPSNRDLVFTILFVDKFAVEQSYIQLNCEENFKMMLDMHENEKEITIYATTENTFDTNELQQRGQDKDVAEQNDDDDVSDNFPREESYHSNYSSDDEGLVKGVVEATVSTSTHPSIILRRKLQDLKTSIRAWRTKRDLNKDNLIRELKNKVTYLELKVKSCDLDDNEIACRLSTLKEIKDMEYLKRLDLMQKAKIKWAIEGDENSKLFHVMINNKFIKSRINGLLINGSWTLDPSQDAVWSCGSSKAPGPDGFTFKFIKHHWDTIRHNFIDMVKRLSKVVHSIVSKVQTTYIKGKQLIDGPLMVNEILAYASKKRERLFFLKVDLKRCLTLLIGSSSIIPWHKWGLVTNRENRFMVALILLIALHVSIQDVKSKGIFEGVNVGSNGINISHLQFSDDALIMGTWSIDNAKNLCRILRCFYMASGLKVNFSKNSLAFVLMNLKPIPLLPYLIFNPHIYISHTLVSSLALT
ncbi:hypothetical protein Tco_0610081 [Tanacetum coccineum]